MVNKGTVKSWLCPSDVVCNFYQTFVLECLVFGHAKVSNLNEEFAVYTENLEDLHLCSLWILMRPLKLSAV